MEILVVGAGGIGSPLVDGLTEQLPGVRVTVADGDRIERSNLPRQPWYQEEDVGQPKAERLAKAMGPHISSVPAFVDDTFRWPRVDLILDATDNWPARQAIERHARMQGIPWVFASAVRWEGQVAWMKPDGPCLACLFGEEPTEGLRCFEAGVVGMVTLATAGQVLWLVDRWLDSPASADLQRLYLLEGRRGAFWSVGLPRGRCPHGA